MAALRLQWISNRVGLAVISCGLCGCQLIAGLTQERELATNMAGGGNASGGAAGASGGATPGGNGNSGGNSGEMADAGSAGDALTTAGGAGPLHAGGASADAGSAAGDVGEGGSAGLVEDLTPRPSCEGDSLNECNGESCCRSLPVPGGPFGMGRSVDGADAFAFGRDQESPEHSVTLSRFALDKYEVTVARMRRFVEAYSGSPPSSGTGSHPEIANSGWQSIWNTRLPEDRAALATRLKCNFTFQTWTDAAGSNELLPINCVDWFVAYAFCIWDHARLPSEAEWEFAATGGAENRLYPWGSVVPTAAYAVFECSAGGGAADCLSNDIRPVGSRQMLGNGRWGHADLAGSMLEHTRDAFFTDYYKQGPASGTNAVNLDTNLDAAGQSVVRGGSYLGDAPSLRAAARNNIYRSTTADGVGLRCARDP